MGDDGRIPARHRLRFSVRIRSLAALSITAIAALSLAGCTGSSEPDASPSAEVSDLCSAAVASGDASNAVSVSGDFGSMPEDVTFETPLDIADLESTIVTEGTGEAVSAGDFVSYGIAVYNSETGELVDSVGYEEGSFLPQQVSPQAAFGQIFGCAPIGTRAVATFPATDSSAAGVYVIDALEIVPTAAWGEEQTPADGFPTVVLDDDGAPTITIPDTDAPTDVELDTLKLGDGPVVESGDTVLVQYTGVQWSDGTVFDSSWESGTPTSFVTTQVVPGFQQALEGQTVGSQVLVVIPPEFGYGEASEDNTNALAGETLVFVVDILGTQHAVTE
nr:FKBP-type peptidyl-prolyl cis-trans isomerase [Microbacterium halimionae]